MVKGIYSAFLWISISILLAGSGEAQTLYVSDQSANSLSAINPSNGTSINVVNSGLSTPNPIALDGLGNLYIGNFGSTGNNTSGSVSVLNLGNSNLVTLVSGLANPNGLAFDPSGNLYIAEWNTVGGNHIIQERTTGGVLSTLVSDPTINFNSLTYFSGSFYTSDWSTGNVYRIIPGSGMVLFRTGLTHPNSIIFDQSGNLFATQGGSSNSIAEIPFGTSTVNTFASGFSNPQGITLDGNGNLYVANAGTAQVLKVDSLGSVSTLSSGFNNPAGVAFAAAVPEPSPVVFLSLAGFSWMLLNRRRQVV